LLNIEITTTQNVTVQHELATVPDRFLAGFVDFIVIALMTLLIGVIVDSADTEAGKILTVLILGVPFVWFYTLTSEALMHGQTLGKKLLRIKVIRVDGRPLTFIDHFTRWSSRLVDIYASGSSLGMIMMISSDKRQRLGGMISGSVVVRKSPRNQFSLNKIKNLNAYKEEDIVYPEAAQLSEIQMLNLKRLLDRKRRYQTEIYNNLMNETTAKIQKDLNITSKEVPDKFVRQLLKDYIVLSR
jgi:uncharacterized RDD family membrane protein YckC